jgi:maltose alpha-D-glucosyltransferase/alpha-amylase
MMPLGSDDAVANAIASWLPQARWFPAKLQAVLQLRIVDRLLLPAADNCEIVIVETEAAHEASPSHFLLAVCEGPDGLVDAAAQPQVARWLIETAVSGRQLQGRVSKLTGHPVPLRSDDVSAGGPWLQTARVMPLSADSSNTLLVIRPEHSVSQPGLVLKLIRHVRSGVHPEVEIGRFLAADTRWRHTPPLRATLEWKRNNGDTAVVAVVHDEVLNAVSLWDLLLTRLTDNGGETPTVAAGSLDDSLMTTMTALGRVTAEMHRSLAADRGDPAFGSEPWSLAARQTAAAAMTSHAGQVFDSLATIKQSLPAASAAMLDDVLGRRDDLLARLATLGDGRWQSRRIRVHGDYHLGQVLMERHGNGVSLEERILVIDFEGEPQRPLEQRRIKQAAAKDVAGMLRSLDYLVRVAGRATSRPLPADTRQRLIGRFLGSYTATAQGGVFWPDDATEAGTLLAIHCLDKAIYELAYEANNRPDWIDVPLAALLEIAGDT